MKNNTLDRFLEAQERDYATALTEIQSGRKRSHWIWYIFPQLKGLGYSPNSEYYGLAGINEATEYLNHSELGLRLIQISTVLLDIKTDDPTAVMGYPDDLKLKSSMTLFAAVPGADLVFEKNLQKFFGGSKDEKTLKLLGR